MGKKIVNMWDLIPYKYGVYNAKDETFVFPYLLQPRALSSGLNVIILGKCRQTRANSKYITITVVKMLNITSK